MKRHHLLLILSLGLLTFLLSSCEIEETKTNQGQIFVDLRDTSGVAISGARISVDGVQTASVTPDTLGQIPVGPHTIEASKPGYLPASMSVTVEERQTVFASLIAEDAPFGAIEMIDAPDGTSLIIDNSEYAIVPPQLVDIGVGTWNVSAYLAGNMTNAPARWSVTLAPRDTVRIDAQFTQLADGPNVGSLAHVFALPSDLDSAIFRLQDYRGKIVLLSFFFYLCNPCLAEFPHIQEVYADPQYAGWLEVFGIDAVDGWSLLARYKEDHPTLGLQFPLLWNQDQSLRTIHYEVASCPTNVLIDPTGMIRYRWLGVTEGELRGAIESLIDEFDTQN